MPEDRPAWLVRMENGSIAEARTKAFLIDRFWILERSVDVEGADFIIQRRLTSKTLLDKNPPRFGIIQAKFFSNENTTHYVHREYVLNADNEPQEEFFLICHTGVEEGSRSFMIDSKQISEQFEITSEEHSKALCFRLSGSKILKEGHFEIINSNLILDRIERALQQADFRKNRSFISWALPSIQINPDDIDSIYLEPLDNWWGNIPKEFYKMKQKVQKSLYEIENAANMLHEIVSTNDPNKALMMAEDIKSEYGDSYHFPRDIFDKDFLNVVREHKERHDNLRKEGLLDSFLSLQFAFIDSIVEDLAHKMKLAKDSVYVVSIEYDKDNFSNFRFTAELKIVTDLWRAEEKESDWSWKDVPSIEGLLSSKPGFIQIYWLPGRYSYDEFKDGKFYPRDIKDWKPELREIAPSRTLMEEIYRLRFS